MSHKESRWMMGLVALAGFFLAGIACSFFERQVESFTGKDTEPVPTATRSIQTDVVSTPTGDLETTPTHTTAAYTVIRASGELLASISALEWTTSGGYTSSLPRVSPDFQAGEALVLSAVEIQVPASCQERSDCRQAVTIQLSSQLGKITCLQAEKVLWGDYCAEVSIPAGAAFRFRGILYDTHPATWNYIPVLELLPASDAACLEGEFRCAVDNTCFAAFDGYCRSCLGLEKERCACQSPQGDLPDGSDCQYWLSGDVLMSGKCQAGVCK